MFASQLRKRSGARTWVKRRDSCGEDGQSAAWAVFMHWVIASLVSAFFLGCYDLFTKHAVRENAVLPVLFFANLCSALIWLGLMSIQHAQPSLLPASFAVTSLTAWQHGQLLLKSAIVAVSWVCSYFAVKHLPVSIASPI